MSDLPATVLHDILVAIQGNATKLLGVVSSVDAMLTKVEDLQTAYRTGIGVVGEKVAELLAAQAGLAAAQLESRTKIMDRIDRLQDTVEVIRADASVNWNTADAAFKRVSNSRHDMEMLRGEVESLRDIMMAMERRNKMLSEQIEELRNRDNNGPTSQ